MNSPDISFYGMANLIMDGAALFILAGMFIYTSLYRRRGRGSDKVFFALILTDVVAALFNGVIYILDGCDIPFESALYPVCFAVFFLAVDAFAILFCVYQMYRAQWQESRIRRTLMVLCIAAAILTIFLFVCVFTNDVYTGTIAVGALSISVYDILNIVPLIICGVFTVCVTFKQSRQTLILIALLIVVHVYLTVISVSNVTPLFLSIYLMYSHLMTMRDSFYGEDAG